MLPIVTVLTPTYNRYNEIQNLYVSLKKQNNKNFIWLIIDDGSRDNTKYLVEQWKLEAEFSIQYYPKSNGGKHTALNYSHQFIKTPMTFIVDSDDQLTEDSINTIENDYKLYRMNKDLCGFSYLRGTPDGGLLSSSKVPRDGMVENYCQCRINREIAGDMAEVWFTDVFKKFPFPEIAGEKFLGEDVVWIRMSRKYKLKFFNKIIYISDYLNNGLTNNRRQYNIQSPKGCVIRANEFLNAPIKTKLKVKAMLQYIIYSKFAYQKSFSNIENTGLKFLWIICYLPAQILYVKWKNQYKV